MSTTPPTTAVTVRRPAFQPHSFVGNAPTIRALPRERERKAARRSLPGVAHESSLTAGRCRKAETACQNGLLDGLERAGREQVGKIERSCELAGASIPRNALEPCQLAAQDAERHGDLARVGNQLQHRF